jgi:HK97 family phage major capsid protein
VSNPYLVKLREKYDSLRTSIEGLQTRAADEDRDLTPDELRSVTEQGDTAKALYEQIESLTAIEVRNRKVSETAASVAGDGDAQTRNVGAATTQDRDPGHYRSAEEGGQNSFFGDLYRAKDLGDESAIKRLAEHNRALNTTGAGSGIVPPKWLTSEYAELARQGRRLANAVRRIPLDDPRPITLPKQTAGTDAAVTEQAAENDPLVDTDLYDTDVDTVTPKPTTGKQTVSRQTLDSTSPAIDILIYGDLMAAFNSKVEAKVCAAIAAAAGTAVTTFATEALFTGTAPAMPAIDAMIDLQLAVREGRKLPATLQTGTVRRWGKFKKLKDSTGRPIIPYGAAGPMNVSGVGSVESDGEIESVPFVATDGFASTYPESVYALRASDVILFESPVMRFRYEEPKGPESIILGIWAYTGVIVRYAGTSVKRAQITAAS